MESAMKQPLDENFTSLLLKSLHETLQLANVNVGALAAAPLALAFFLALLVLGSAMLRSGNQGDIAVSANSEERMTCLALENRVKHTLQQPPWNHHWQPEQPGWLIPSQHQRRQAFLPRRQAPVQQQCRWFAPCRR